MHSAVLSQIIGFRSSGTDLLHIQEYGKTSSCLFGTMFADVVHNDGKKKQKKKQKVMKLKLRYIRFWRTRIVQ